MSRERVWASAPGNVVRFLLMFWLAAHGKARQLPDTSPPVRMDQVKSGTLLLSTDKPGVFVPAPALDTEVSIRVTGIVARASVRQKFANASNDCVEGVYAFPLPEASAVDRMRLTIGQRVIEGEVREREEAKKVYEQAKSEGKKASLVEQERPNIFTASVASIGPNESVEIEIEYQETLRYDAGKLELRFPMVVAPRYIPGAPLSAAAAASAPGAALPAANKGMGWAPNTDRVPDAERVTTAVMKPGESRVNPIRMRVELSPGARLRRLESPTHLIQASAGSETSYTVTVGDATLAADRDFVLDWEPDLADRPRPALFAENRDGEIFALLVMLPPDVSAAKAVRLPRETIFIIDTSGSMYGPSIDQARRSLLFALDRLRSEDRFNVIEFNSVMHRLYTESRRALPEAIAEAKQWVSKLEAGGGTEMLPALEAALEGAEPSVDSTEVRQVVFITDGGVGNEDELFRYIRDHLGRSRLFTVGIGSAPNSHFMTRAAEFGRGTFTYVGNRAEVEEKMGGLFRKLESPVLTNVRLAWDDATVEVWPEKIPDLYAGEPLVVTARLSRASGTVTVSGDRSGETWSERVPIALSSGDRGIDRLWGRRKISALMDRSAGSTLPADRDQFKREAIEVAVRHHLLSAFTSLVAVDVTPTLARGTVCVPRAVPVHLPAGWDYGHVFGEAPQTATPGRLYLLIAFAAAAMALLLRAFAGGSRP
ncbi:MAG TPA: marine proteobacterial sortase target protein [Thermoanaerobaculia bacterium]|nr:marine proteobacterial sortase target protein [Thermoanaerobaculia bacterium]